MKKTFTTKLGFTLVEVLIAMVILVAIIGAVTMIESKNISFSSSSKYQTQANGLAAEGLNVVKQIADKNKLENPSINGDCKDPSDSDSVVCPSGYYYLNNANELKLCGQCKDPSKRTDDPTNTPFACPTDLTGAGSQNYICANSDLDAKETVNDKEFTRTIIIP